MNLVGLLVLDGYVQFPRQMSIWKGHPYMGATGLT